MSAFAEHFTQALVLRDIPALRADRGIIHIPVGEIVQLTGRSIRNSEPNEMVKRVSTAQG